jgi:hypothetical protein
VSQPELYPLQQLQQHALITQVELQMFQELQFRSLTSLMQPVLAGQDLRRQHQLRFPLVQLL